MLGLIFITILAFYLLSIGTAEHTGVTGKDEYYLSMRIPLCMQEQQVWVIPCLDTQPRLRKPPLLYWLTRASFEVFGTSIASARLVAVSFGAMLILAVGVLTLQLGHSIATAINTSLVMLSCVGLAIGGRILELDVPVATFSTWATVGLLHWYHTNRLSSAFLAIISLSAGFLTKGPVVAVVCGSGILALLMTDRAFRQFLRTQRLHILLLLSTFILLTTPWFIYVYLLYPNVSSEVLQSELAARRFLHLSLTPISGTILLAWPWSFIVLLRIYHYKLEPSASKKHLPMLILWLIWSLVPFFLMRSFERYLIGSLVPIALLLSIHNHTIPKYWIWPARIGLTLALIITTIIQILAITLAGISNSWWLIITISVNIWFVMQWWYPQHLRLMALSAALLWSSTMGLVYPKLGINKIPVELVTQVKTSEVVLFDGPQPALLPALLQRSLIHIDNTWQLPKHLLTPCTQFFLLANAWQNDQVLSGITTLQLQASVQSSYGIFSSQVKWVNMFRPGLSAAQIINAIRTGHLETIKPQVILYKISNPKCTFQAN